MTEREVTLELIHAKLVELHEEVKAMRAEYATLVALVRDLQLDRNEPRRVH